MAYTLLLVDDEEEILKMLGNYFALLGYRVLEASSAKRAMELLPEAPDLILLDIHMPEMDGLELCRQIREQVGSPILFLTAKIEEQDRVQGFLAGGDDYILKPVSMDELQARVMAHLRREERRTGQKAVKNFGGVQVDYSDRLLRVSGKEVLLTKTEFDIVELLSRNKGRIFTKEDIYERIWGYDKEGDSASIMEHVRRIRKKIQRETEDEVIGTVWGVGYRWII